MGIRTLGRYLIGQRQATLDIAACPAAVWIGLLFVLSAGFAREYDGEDLWHEPWHLLIPLGASLASSLLLFLLSWGVARLKGASGPGFLTAYLSFLGLFWMTAPLAWLYAIPYERFLSPVDAMAANLWTLGIVSVWRVALMMRVLAVLMNYGWRAVFIVMLFADVVALVVAESVPVPIFVIMGGIRLSPSERLLAATAGNLFFLGICSLPIWLIGAVVSWVTARPAWAPAAPPSAPSRPLWALAVLSVAIWAAVLPFTQPEQALRRQVHTALREGRIADALQIMSRHQRDDFPPSWEPLPSPPRFPSHRLTLLLDVLEGIAAEPSPSWVTDLYLEELYNALHAHVDDGDLAALADLYDRLPQVPHFLSQASRRPQGYSHLGSNLKRIDAMRAGDPEH